MEQAAALKENIEQLPLIKQANEGTLSAEQVKTWAGQDLCFLEAYVRAIALCMGKLDGGNMDAMAFMARVLDDCSARGRDERIRIAGEQPQALPAVEQYGNWLEKFAMEEDIDILLVLLTVVMQHRAWVGSLITLPAETSLMGWLEEYARGETRVWAEKFASITDQRWEGICRPSEVEQLFPRTLQYEWQMLKQIGG